MAKKSSPKKPTATTATKKTASKPAKAKTTTKVPTTKTTSKPTAAKTKAPAKTATPVKPAPTPTATPTPAKPEAPAKPAPAPVVELPTKPPSTAFTKALTKHFGRLGDDDLAAGVTEYVLDGTEPEVVLRLGAVAEAGKALALCGVSNNIPHTLRQDIEKERLAVYREGAEVSPKVWARLGEVFESAALASGRKSNSLTGWPIWLSSLLSELVVSYLGAGRTEGAVWPAERLLPLFAEAGLPPREALRMLLDSSLVSHLRRAYAYGYYGSSNSDTIFDGWPAVLAQNMPAVREVFEKLGNYQAPQVLPILSKLGFDFAPVLDLVGKLGVSTSKSVRDLVSPILHKNAAAAFPHVEKLLTDGNASQRNEAGALLWKIDGKKAIGIIRKQFDNESSEKVKQSLEKLLSAPIEEADEGEPITLPPVDVKLGKVPFPEVARNRLWEVIKKWHENAMRYYEQQLARWNSPDKPSWMPQPVKPQIIEMKYVHQLFDFVSGEREDLLNPNEYRRAGTKNFPDDSFAPPDVHLIHVVRLCYALNRFDLERTGEYGLSWYDTSDLEAYRGHCEKPFGLRELEVAFNTLPNAKPGMIAFAYLQNNNKYRDFCDWEPEAIWPAFADRTDMLRDTLSGALQMGQRDYYLPERRRNVFRILAMFPKLPPGFVPLLWDIAMGDAKTDRPLAQAALRSLPDKTARIIASLSNGRQVVRETAAEWLGNIGDKSAIAPLKEAFRNEKQESTKGVIMVALEKLKADVSEFLDRDALAKEARDGMKKAPPIHGASLAQLPAVHWQDTGKPVDPQIVQWWVVQAAQQGSAACGPILRRYLAMCRPIDTAALAKTVLTGWLDRAAQRGLLAIVAAAGDADCVRMSEKYIRTWFGQKMSQCKSLIEVLAWIKHPMGLQVLLSIANRFRTRGLRELAASLVNSIAEREGWTVDELADRTIPDAGFAKPTEGGRAALILDYGPRQFTATLDDELEPILTGEGGKTVRALPNAAKADDPVKAKEAKKIFSDAKKQVKDAVKRQRERLYEALCTQRAWRFADWKQFLGDHPIAGRLCVRLAWSASEPGDNGKFLGCFRPLEDGSLTNEKDDAVTFPPETLIRLAHTANTTPELAAAWKQHFTDYKVEPLFVQFGRESYTLPEAKKKETEIKDFQGYEIGTFQIRGKMTKLGYVRGEPGDGGWFREYLKPFRSLGIQAEIEFSGNSLPEEDRRAALHSLSFVRIKPEGDSGAHWNRKAMELGKVPPVLLSECYNDLKQLASEGTGFNPEWEKSSYY